MDGYRFCTTNLPTSVHDERSDVMEWPSSEWRSTVVGVLVTDDNNKGPLPPQQSQSPTTTATTAPNYASWNTPLEWAWHMELPAVILPPIPTSWTILDTPATTTPSPPLPPIKQESDEVPMDTTTTTNPTTTTRTSPALVSALWDYAQAVRHAARNAHRVDSHLWIAMTLPASVEQAQEWLHNWRTVQQFIANRHHNNIGILLDIQQPSSSSSSSSSSSVLSSVAWGKLQVVFLHHLLGMATIRGCRLACADFLTNKGGFPALSRGVQFITAWLLQRLGGPSLRFLVQGPACHFTNDLQAFHHHQALQSNHNNHNNSSVIPPNQVHVDRLGVSGCLPYIQYLQHIRKRPDLRLVLDTFQARAEENHCDRLQRPLQPLGDHLENATYQTFEQDPIKYNQYQQAIAMALTDLVATASTNNNNTATATPPPRGVVVLVVGAGRGPLVQRVVQAYLQLPVPQRPSRLSLYAVEKNPSAILYLQAMVRHHAQWQERYPISIQVVHSDLRHLTSPILNNQKADLIVSELLGSFGDNELSPECLDPLFQQPHGPHSVCQPHTISIPTRYTSYLAPVSSWKLHQKVQEQALYPADDNDTNGSSSGVIGLQRATETPYVVRSRVASQMATALPCWTFAHPNTSTTNPNHATTRNTATTLESSNHNNHNLGNDWNQRVYLEFDNLQDRSTSAQWGPGYGPVEEKIATMLDESSNNPTTTTPTAAAATTQQAQFRPSQCHFPWILTGFLGTFAADLYIRRPVSSLSAPEIVSISICPQTFSKGMFSWFPLYFPLAQPLSINSGEGEMVVGVHMIRKSSVSEQRVWYEWAAVVRDKGTGTILEATPIHNPNGRSYHVSSSSS